MGLLCTVVFARGNDSVFHYRMNYASLLLSACFVRAYLFVRLNIFLSAFFCVCLCVSLCICLPTCMITFISTFLYNLSHFLLIYFYISYPSVCRVLLFFFCFVFYLLAFGVVFLTCSWTISRVSLWPGPQEWLRNVTGCWTITSEGIRTCRRSCRSKQRWQLAMSTPCARCWSRATRPRSGTPTGGRCCISPPPRARSAASASSSSTEVGRLDGFPFVRTKTLFL